MSGIELNFSVVHDEMAAFAKALKDMQAKEVLVGFPEEGKPREDENGNPTPVTNAVIAYSMDKGMPEHNVPARPFMEPGVESKREPISDGLEAVGMAALDGNSQKVDQGFHAVGTIARDAIKAKILDGPFDPLAESTLKARARHGGAIGDAAQQELDRRESGVAPGVDLARPLNFTGQLRNACTYVLRDKEK